MSRIVWESVNQLIHVTMTGILDVDIAAIVDHQTGKDLKVHLRHGKNGSQGKSLLHVKSLVNPFSVVDPHRNPLELYSCIILALICIISMPGSNTPLDLLTIQQLYMALILFRLTFASQ